MPDGQRLTVQMRRREPTRPGMCVVLRVETAGGHDMDVLLSRSEALDLSMKLIQLVREIGDDDEARR